MHNTFTHLISLLHYYWISDNTFYIIGGYDTYLKAVKDFGINDKDDNAIENMLHKKYNVNKLICYTKRFILEYEWMDDADGFIYTSCTSI